jgi:multidrug resistance efflux pump
MKTLLILIMLAALVLLYLDDKSKRAALDQAQAQLDAQSSMPQQIQSLTAERDQLKVALARLTGNPNSTTSNPSWFQQRLNEPSALNESPGSLQTPAPLHH